MVWVLWPLWEDGSIWNGVEQITHNCIGHSVSKCALAIVIEECPHPSSPNCKLHPWDIFDSSLVWLHAYIWEIHTGHTLPMIKFMTVAMMNRQISVSLTLNHAIPLATSEYLQFSALGPHSITIETNGYCYRVLSDVVIVQESPAMCWRSCHWSCHWIDLLVYT